MPLVLRAVKGSGLTNTEIDGNFTYLKEYAETLVAGLLDFRGTYDASGNTYPTSGSGTAGAVMKGDCWYISVSGTLGSVAVVPGDFLIALVDTPGQTAGNWDALELNIGFVPADSATTVTLGSAQNITGAKTFSNSTIIIKGSSTGTTTLTSNNTSASDWTVLIPSASFTLAGTNINQTFSAIQASNVNTLTDQATISWDVTTKQSVKVTITANRAIETSGSPADGVIYMLRVVASGGAYTINSFNSTHFKGLTGITQTGVSGAVDEWTFVGNGTALCCTGFRANIEA